MHSKDKYLEHLHNDNSNQGPGEGTTDFLEKCGVGGAQNHHDDGDSSSYLYGFQDNVRTVL